LEIDLGDEYPLFYVTHIDHKDEGTRLIELKSALTKINNNRPHLFMGDFNSLRQDDYKEETLNEIKIIRQNQKWEEPHFDVVNTLCDSKYIDCWKYCNPDTKDKFTCSYKTRIDYIWAKNVIEQWDITNCDIIDNEFNISDHLPVIAEFKKK